MPQSALDPRNDGDNYIMGPPGGCRCYWGRNVKLVTQLQTYDCLELWFYFPKPLHSFSDLLCDQVTHSTALRRHSPTSKASARPDLSMSALTVRSRSGKDPVPVRDRTVPWPYSYCGHCYWHVSAEYLTVTVTVRIVWIGTHCSNCSANIAASCISTSVTRQPVHRQLHFAGSRVQSGGELRWSERQWDTFCHVSVRHSVCFVPRGRTVGLLR
jgi:hypothetical protein